MTVVLETRGLTAGYGDLAAVRDLDVAVQAGEVVALLGANGAGKTTSLLACVGLLPAMRGEVRWFGRPRHVALHRLAREGVAYVPEGRSVTTGLSVLDNLRLGRGGVDGALAIFGELEPLLGRPAGLLSGGEQQMLVLARALASEPRALLVDELSMGLAPLIVKQLLSAVRRAADEDGLAVLLVEQQVRDALAVADRWCVLRGGSVTREGAGDAELEALEAAYLADSVDGQSHPVTGGET